MEEEQVQTSPPAEEAAEDLSVLLEQLSRGMQQQRRFVSAYGAMLSAVPTREDRALLQAMQREERRHYYLMEGILEELGGVPHTPAGTSFSMPKQYMTMLQVMLCDKLETIDFYEQMEQSFPCAKHRELFAIVVGDQKEQARILATMYRKNEG